MLFRSPALVEKVEQFQAKLLTPEQELAFLTRSTSLRWADKYRIAEVGKSVPVTDWARPRREEDNGRSLWQVLNRAQEALLRGGTRFGSMTRRAGAVRGLSAQVKINEGVWELAEEFATAE